jgi:sugar phosphate isomerase/epimerase
MDRVPALSRRSFVRLGVSAAALSPLAGLGLGFGLGARARAAAPESSAGDPWKGLKVGIASYSFSKLPLDVTIDTIRGLGLHYVSIKDAHLPLKSTAAQRKAVAQQFRDAGITPLSCGNIGMSDDEAEIRNAFEYARDAGIPVIVCKPTRKSLPQLDKMVKEFDIRIAIHNHGPEDNVWPSPYVAWEAIRPFDERIGLCIDVGHTVRCGVDPTEALRKCSARLYDVHLKDLASKEGKSLPVELGKGVLDLRSMMQALLDIGFSRHVGLEYEKDLKNPIPGATESIEYLRGLMAEVKKG